MSRQKLTAAPILENLKGHFSVSRRFVPAATTLAGVLWALRNPSGSGVLTVLLRARLRALQTSVPTGVHEGRFNLKVARGYTAGDTTNGVAITPAAAQQKSRTSMSDSAIAVHEASAAAGLSGGTSTLDTNPSQTGSLWVLAAMPTGGGHPVEIFDFRPNMADGEHPLVLAEDEGLQIANENNFGTNSGLVLHLELRWAEVTRW